MKLLNMLLGIVRQPSEPAVPACDPFVILGDAAELTGHDRNGNSGDGGQIQGYQYKM